MFHVEYLFFYKLYLYKVMIYHFTHVMSSVVETSLKRFLHSLRSVGMTTSGKMYIVPFLGNDMSVTHVMSSVVETSFKRFLHSLRSVGMTTSGKMYIAPIINHIWTK